MNIKGEMLFVAVKYKFRLSVLLKKVVSVFLLLDCILPSKQTITWIQFQAQLA